MTLKGRFVLKFNFNVIGTGCLMQSLCILYALVSKIITNLSESNSFPKIACKLLKCTTELIKCTKLLKKYVSCAPVACICNCLLK